MDDALGHKRLIEANFRQIADLYEGLRFTQVCARRLVELVDPQPAERILDAATGTGMAALLAAHLVGTQGQVLGVDLSADMLAVAQARLAASGLPNVTFIQADLQHMMLETGPFDAVLCASSLFFIPDMVGALRRCWAALRPGGRMGFSSFGPGFLRPLHSLWRERLSAHGVTNPSIPNARLEQPHDCTQVLLDAGFTQVQATTEQLGYFLTPEQRWGEIVAGLEGIPLRSLDAQTQDQVRREHLAELQGLAGPRGVWVNVEANFALGVRPAAPA